MPSENDCKCLSFCFHRIHNTLSLSVLNESSLFHLAPLAYHSTNSEASEQDFPMASPAEEVGAQL